MKKNNDANSGGKISNPPQNRGEAASYSGQVVKGSFWILGLRLTNRALGLIRTFVLARLLLPEDFGLIGVATLAISTVETFSQPGLGMALVQKKDVIHKYLDTVWTVSVLRSVIVYLLLFIFAPYVTEFFKSPQAKSIIQVFGLSVIIAGCRNSGVVFFQKNLDFKKQYIYELSILMGNILVAIPAAIILGNVWALVLGGIAGSITRFAMSYALHPFRPSLRFEKEKFLELFGFGRWVLGSSILFFLVTQGDDIFLGKFFGVTALGLYQMAYMISNLPTTETSRVISHVTFPAYSQLQDDIDRFRTAYFKVLQMVLFISVPIAGAIFVFASDAIHFFLSDRWIEAAPLLRILVWAGLVQAFVDTTASVFNACGKPSINTRWQLVNLAVLVTCIYPFAMHLGTSGVAITVVIANILSALVSIHAVRKVFSFEILNFLKILFCPLISMLVSAAIIAKLRGILQYNNVAETALLLFVGALLYAFITFCFDVGCNLNIGKLIKETFRSFRTINS